MGRLLGLELCDFKSYKGTVKIGFGKSDFISIIGPNGSGKSNLMDAISFVLGVRSSQLRSSVLKDLIYRGKISDYESENENKENLNPLNGEELNSPVSAYVKAFYLKTDEDGNEIKTVEFVRSINKKGESSYKIDNKSQTFKSYTDALEKENILVRAKNFLVFQGDVEQVASQNSAELTRLFEQVSGSIQFKKQYEELNEQYKHALQMSSDGLFKKRRLQNELIHYKDGVSKDEKYKEKVQERKELWVQYTLWQLSQLEQKKTRLQELHEDIKEKIQNTKKDINKEEKHVSSSKTAYSKSELKIVRMRDDINSIEENVESLKSQLLPLIQNKRSAARKIEQIQRKIETFTNDIERQETILKNLGRNLKVVSKSKKQYEEEMQKSKNSKFQLDDAAQKEYNTLKEKYLTSGGLELDDAEGLKNSSIKELKDELKKYEDQIANSMGQVETLKQEKDASNIELKELTESLNEKNTQHTLFSEDLKFLQTNLQKLHREETQINYKLRDTLLKIDELNADQRESKKEHVLRENVSSLRRLFPGVKGLVNELCKPKKEKHNTAVSIILGRNFDSIIVDTIATAQQCISYLKEQRAGSATFIPLDTVEITPAKRIQWDRCILTVEALEYDPSLERAIQYVCGDSIICDNLEVAKDLKWNKNIDSKIVTLNGSLIQKSGLMTGGVSKMNSQNRWDKEEYKSLLSLKDKFIQNLAETQQQIRKDQNKSRDLELQIGALNNELSVIRTQLNHNDRLKKEQKGQLEYYTKLIEEDYNVQKAKLEENITNLESAIKEIETKKNSLKNKIYSALSEKLGFSLIEYESTTGETIRKQSKDLEILQKEIINIQSKISFEEDRLISTNKRIEKLKRDLKVQNTIFENYNTEERELTQKIGAAQNSYEDHLKKLVDFKTTVAESSKQLDGIEEQLQEFNSKLVQQKKDSFVIKNDIEEVDVERLKILRNCQMTLIDLPLVSGTLEDLPLDKIDTIALDYANSIEIDYDYLDDAYAKEVSNLEVSHNLNKAFERNIDLIEEELVTLQPNTHAHDRLSDVQTKFQLISKEVEGLKKHEKAVFEKFNEVKNKRKALFEKTFDHANTHIDAVYKELTKDPNSQVALAGGSASLIMEDSDEPYLSGIKYHATPPLKRFKEMEHLSGGEKTVAALALLFTINSFQPSPFFVLDEVDAALDVTNVERVAAYIKKNANPSFQFIVISLKNTMFEKSDALVGVFRDQSINSSQVLTLDLSKYAA